MYYKSSPFLLPVIYDHGLDDQLNLLIKRTSIFTRNEIMSFIPKSDAVLGLTSNQLSFSIDADNT